MNWQKDPWESNPPPCEVTGCGNKSLPYFTPDAEGIPCKCGKWHRVCSGHFTKTVYNASTIIQVYGYVDGVYTQLLCPNDALVALEIAGA